MSGVTNGYTSKGHWYCKNCMLEVDPKNVIYDELHEDCGSKVEWIEVVPGMLFNKPQKAFYQLTGKKPLILVTYGGNHIITACEEYRVFLEKNYLVV